MPFKKESPPRVGDVLPKGRGRRIKKLADLRWVYGESTLIDTHTHKHQYPIDEIGAALRRIKREALKLQIDFYFSADEKKLWSRMIQLLIAAAAFWWVNTTDDNHNFIPDCLEQFFQEKKDADWIEKSLGLPDDEIEKRLGLLPHEIEKHFEEAREREREREICPAEKSRQIRSLKIFPSEHAFAFCLLSLGACIRFSKMAKNRV